MPESVRDRPTTSHEYVLLLTKSAKYFYDADAIREPHADSGDMHRRIRKDGDYQHNKSQRGWMEGSLERADEVVARGRNKRTVWTIPTKPYPDAHFATFPPDLIEPMILTTPTKCCAECGAGWERVIEGKASEPQRKTYHGKGQMGNHRCGGDRPGGFYPNSKTLGFRPTCSCFGKPKYEMATCPSCKGSGVTEQRDGSEKRCGRCRGKTKVRVFAYNGFGFPAEVLDKWPTKPAIVLDLFAGTGTVGQVAGKHGRDFTLIELVPEYIPLIKKGLSLAAPKEIKTPKTKGHVVVQTALPFEDGFEIIDDSTER